ncbi:MAG: tetratricopeptide repeat protein, partial [Roseiarcus sp.]
GRVVKTTGDGLLLEFPSVVAAVECAIAVQKLMAERNAGTPEDKRIVYRIGVNLGDVLIEGDDILGDGVNIAARLEGICEPGGVLISGAAYDHVRGRIDAHFVDLGEKDLKNIARPVRVYAVKIGSESVSPLPASAPNKQGPPRLSLVVLPFANLGGDPEQDYFVDGVTESLTTDLSRIRGSFVIGRNTAFTYKGKAVDLKQIGRELNVRYVLEGSVQRGGNRMRVNVQLIDAESGNHLWAERFDKPLADLFDIQDEIVARLANQLQAELMDAEARRAEQTPNPDSIDLVFQGRALYNRGFAPEMLAKAREFYERALDLDPGNVDALVGAALVDIVLSYATDDLSRFRAAAEVKLSKALTLAPNHAFAHAVMGVALCATNRIARGIEELERALAIDPNLATARAHIGGVHAYIDRAGETEAQVLEALRLSPRDRSAYAWLNHIGWSKACVGEFADAALWFRRSIDVNHNNLFAYFNLAACLAHLGRIDEARREAEAGLAVAPNFTIRRFRAAAESDNAAYLVQRERIIEGMRLAGVPEE